MKDYGWLDVATARPLTSAKSNVGSAEMRSKHDLPFLLTNAEQIVTWIQDKLNVLMSNVNDIDLTNIFETRLLLNRVEHDIKHILQYDVDTLRSFLSQAVVQYRSENIPKSLNIAVDNVSKPTPYPNTTGAHPIAPSHYHTVTAPMLNIGVAYDKQNNHVQSYDPLADVDTGKIDDD